MCWFNALVHNENGEYWAEVPALPGCYAMGKTQDEVRENIRTAISLHLEAARPDEADENVELMRVAL